MTVRFKLPRTIRRIPFKMLPIMLKKGNATDGSPMCGRIYSEPPKGTHTRNDKSHVHRVLVDKAMGLCTHDIAKRETATIPLAIPNIAVKCTGVRTAGGNGSPHHRHYYR